MCVHFHNFANMTGGGNSVKLSVSKRSLPIIGPATGFLVFPLRDPDSAVKGLKGAARTFVEAELAIARCEFKRGMELTERLIRDERYVFAAVRIGIISAIGLGDLKAFDCFLKALADRGKRNTGPVIKCAVAITEAWLRQFLWISDGYPEWMDRFDLTDVPAPWRPAVAYLGVKIRLCRGQFESAYATASLFLNFICPQHGISAACSYAKFALAIACRETDRTGEMLNWLDEMIRALAPHGFLLPLLLFMHGMHKSPVETLLAELAPDQVQRYRALAKGFFANLIRARNHYTGERTTEELSFREFYLAMLLKRGWAYKELADRFTISIGRMRNIVSILYEKLHIHSRSELKDLVW